MGVFTERLRRGRLDPAGRRWLFVPYDQLTDAIGPLSREPARELGIVVVEAPEKAGRRPYHKQKLALVLSNLRAFALEQVARGVAVRHVVAERDYASALRPLTAELGTMRVMEPAERELRTDLAPLVQGGALEVIAHEGWLTTRDDFVAGAGASPPWRMDAFYRYVRRRSGILWADGGPEGGKLSFDAENREPWRGDPPAPSPPRFEDDDPVKAEVLDLVEARFADHPGALDGGALPSTRADAERMRAFALEACLPHFGPYEDAMSVASTGLFHTRLAPLLNLQRVSAAELVRDVVASSAPIASREGFVRQVLGWREFVRHVHRETDGLRALGPLSTKDASPSYLGADRPLPRAFWGEAPSGLACLDRVVSDVWREGYSHHITRLMILSNLATLLDVSPRELTDWFWAAYTDAYDWVVEPNVLAMGTFGAGPLMTTKPYVSGAGYIARMSDYCGACAFDPARDCPVTRLYWAFLARHAEALGAAGRMGVVLAAARKRKEAEREADARTFEEVTRALDRGEALRPEPSREGASPARATKGAGSSRRGGGRRRP